MWPISMTVVQIYKGCAAPVSVLLFASLAISQATRNTRVQVLLRLIFFPLDLVLTTTANMMMPKMMHLMALVAMFLGLALAAESKASSTTSSTTSAVAQKSTTHATSHATKAASKTSNGSKSSKTGGSPALTSAPTSGAGSIKGDVTLISVSLAAGLVTFGLVLS
ncbi:hypothetical protein CDD81_4544 [Ophiocordyceps australis]|uniref:Uncharacterized protein n=1 Tax=Ophiocordyceps australis TaxID=1399860 RepID=A0A2C5XAF0_9HYPO|nr:hypothetical protein CDD81_4544 [Ophiocordyceps australis]